MNEDVRKILGECGLHEKTEEQIAKEKVCAAMNIFRGICSVMNISDCVHLSIASSYFVNAMLEAYKSYNHSKEYILICAEKTLDELKNSLDKLEDQDA